MMVFGSSCGKRDTTWFVSSRASWNDVGASIPGLRYHCFCFDLWARIVWFISSMLLGDINEYGFDVYGSCMFGELVSDDCLSGGRGEIKLLMISRRCFS